MYEFQFKSNAIEDLEFWTKHDSKIIKKIESLLISIRQTPFAGLGKPEALRYELAGYWSRRINKEHRIIYKVDEVSRLITIYSLRYHYDRKLN